MRRMTLSLIIFFAVFFSHAVSASTFQDSGINPFFKNSPHISIPAVPKSTSKATTVECTSYSDLVSAFRTTFESRTTALTIHMVYDFLLSNVNTIVHQAMWEALGSDDYLLFNYSSFSSSGSGMNGNATVNFTFTYLTTANQERYVSDRVAQILGQIVTDGMTTLEMEKAVHDWIVQHVQYDYSLTYYSAYDGFYRGITVCNGYSLMAYKMLRCLGLDVRIAYGTGNGGLHGWNMVYLNGNWFHMDCTWDDPNNQSSNVYYTYFNLSDIEITALDHQIGYVVPSFTDYPPLPAAPASFSEVVYSAYIPTGNRPDSPMLMSPVSGQTDVSLTPTFTTGAFSDPDIGDTHSKTLWQIATNNQFTECVYYDTSYVDLTALTLPSSAYLPDDTVCYWRVKFFDNNGNSSDWSSTYSFTTTHQNNAPDDPVLISPDDGAPGITITPTLTASEFSDSDRWDTHLKTQWQISSVGDFSTITFDMTSTTDLTQITLTSAQKLSFGTTYYWRARYYDSGNTASGWSTPNTFITLENSPPQAPDLDHPVNGSHLIDIQPTLATGAFSDPDVLDSHLKTQWQVSTSVDFSTPVLEKTSTTSLTTLTLSSAEALNYSTPYFWRVRFYDSYDTPSAWSTVFTFTTTDQPNGSPLAPELESPLNWISQIDLQPLLTTGEFNDPDAMDFHLKTQWQVSMSPDFTSPAIDTTSTTALTEFTVPGSDVLQENTTYYWRVRFYDNKDRASDWSATYAFTTLGINEPPNAPILSKPVNSANQVSLKPTLTTESFSDPDTEDTHWKTQWQISRTLQFSETLLDITSDTALISITLTESDKLPESTTLYWRARYYDNNGAPSDWSETETFTTLSLSGNTTDDGGGGGGGGCFIASLTE